jgi:hypothetical protein
LGDICEFPVAEIAIQAAAPAQSAKEKIASPVLIDVTGGDS